MATRRGRSLGRSTSCEWLHCCWCCNIWMRRAKLKAARCSRWLLFVASNSSAWLALELFGAGDEPISGGEYRVAFGALEQLQSLRVKLAWGISMHRLLRHAALIRPLRTLTLCCESDRLLTADDPASAHPRRADLLYLLAALPQLHVRLVLPRTLGEWRMSGWYRLNWRAADGSGRVDDQWRQLWRLGEGMDRVIVVAEGSE